MKSCEFKAVVYDGEVYCIGCLPEGVNVESDEVAPIFADSEWDTAPVCCECDEIHDYMNITGRNSDDDGD